MKKNEIRAMLIFGLNILLLYFFVWKNFVSLQSYQVKEKESREELESIEKELLERQRESEILVSRKSQRDAKLVFPRKPFAHPMELEDYLSKKIEQYQLVMQSFSRIQWEEERAGGLVLLPMEIVGEKEQILYFLRDLEEGEKYIRFSGQYFKLERRAKGRAFLRATLRCYIEGREDFSFQKRGSKIQNYVRRRKEDEDKTKEKF